MELLRKLKPEKPKQGARQIDQGADIAAARAGLKLPGSGNDKRDLLTLTLEDMLAKPLNLTTQSAMVRRDDEDRVIKLTAFFEDGENLTDLIIDPADHAIVVDLGFADLFLGQTVKLDRFREGLLKLAQAGDVRKLAGEGMVRIVGFIPTFHNDRGVGLIVGKTDEVGTLLLTDPVDRILGQTLRIIVETFGIKAGCVEGKSAARDDAVERFAHVLRKAKMHLRTFGIIDLERMELFREMGFAEVCGRVAGLCQLFRERSDGAREAERWQACFVIVGTGLFRPHAGHQAGA